MSNRVDAELIVRVGCDLTFECHATVTALLIVRPRSAPAHRIWKEELHFDANSPHEEFTDTFGNLVQRVTLAPGLNHIRHDALVKITTAYDRPAQLGDPASIDTLPSNLLRYTLPSRYCDSDKLLDFAWAHFGNIADGSARVQAICDWLHENIEYRFGSGRPDISAYEIIERGFGVCRDFAHCMVALCRTFNLPARYVTGHLPDIGHVDPGSPMDFHAYAEVYLGERWITFDARYNEPRIGRITIAHGLDAVDSAFSTTYGQARLSNFEVWAYQIDPAQVSIGDPIDLSKRLDGTDEIRFA
jgi:transglutaminase-like putative cysteine protease